MFSVVESQTQRKIGSIADYDPTNYSSTLPHSSLRQTQEWEETVVFSPQNFPCECEFLVISYFIVFWCLCWHVFFCFIWCLSLVKAVFLWASFVERLVVTVINQFHICSWINLWILQLLFLLNIRLNVWILWTAKWIFRIFL